MINFILGIFAGIIIGLMISMFIHNTITIYRLTKKYIIYSIDKEFGFRRKKEAKCQIDDGWDACYDEIMMYLHDHPEIDNYVILDDDYDMERLSEHLVKLPPQSIGQNQLGLQKHYAEAAIAILKKDFKR